MAMSKPVIELYTDGACRGNPGPGGWAYLTRRAGESQVREDAGAEAETTNNRMELMAVIRGLESLAGPAEVHLYSDSVYVVKGLTEWLDGWLAKGWRNAARKPVKNKDLWQRLVQLREEHELRAHWVKGHADHPENERCDQLATACIVAVFGEAEDARW
ncbi:MAG: ribonuclease HI [Phycisphaerales bacterium JB038]